MVNFLEKVIEFLHRRSKKPWAKFTVSGIQEDGNVKFDMSWNAAFIDDVCNAGFAGASEQESVENFLLGAIMYPKEMENEVTSSAHPNLRAESELHRIQKG